MVLPPVTLRGAQVTLEPLRADHAAELWPAASDAALWAYLPMLVRTPSDLEAWVAGRLAAVAEGRAQVFLQRAADGRAAGSTSLFDLDLHHRTGEIGHTWIGAEFRRTALNTEAKLLLFTHAFETLQLRRVQLKTDSRNLRSQVAIERLGAVREGVLRRHVVAGDGVVRDSVLYSVIAEEWPAVRGRLRGLLTRK